MLSRKKSWGWFRDWKKERTEEERENIKKNFRLALDGETLDTQRGLFRSIILSNNAYQF